MREPRFTLRIPLAVKMAFTMLIVVAAVWAFIHFIQSRALRDFVIDYHLTNLEFDAQEKLLRFVQYLRVRKNSVEVLVISGKVIRGLEQDAVANKDKISIQYSNSPPAWFPPKSFAWEFLKSSYALLIDPYGRVREVYEGVERPIPNLLLSPEELLTRMMHAESIITLIEGIPFQLVVKDFYSPERKLHASILFAFPIDSDFLKASQGAILGNHIVALLDNDGGVIMSTDPGIVSRGSLIDSLDRDYLVIRKSIFGGREFEADMNFASLVPKSEINVLTNKVLTLGYKNGVIYGVAFILSSTMVIVFLSSKIRKLSKEIVDYLQSALRVKHTVRSTDDELFALQEAFHHMKDRILVHQNQMEINRQIGILANSSLNLDRVLKSILSGTMEASKAQAGMIFLNDMIRGRLILGTSIGISDDFIKDLIENPVSHDEGLIGKIVQSSKPVFIRSGLVHDQLVSRPIKGEEEFHSFLGLPIYAAGDLVGVMSLLTRTPHVMSEHDITLAITVGAHVGSAIRNAELFEQVKRAEEDLLNAHDELEHRVEQRTTDLKIANEQLHQEITDRKLAENALRESEERYRTLFEKTTSPIFVIDTDGNYIDCNEAAVHFVECSRDELMKKNVNSFLPSGRLGHGHDTGSPFWKKSGNIESEYLINERIKVLDLTITPVVWHGKPVVFAVGLDITERKRAEGALQKAHDELEARVEKRTVELRNINVALEQKITEHKDAQDKIRKSLQEKELLLREIHHRVKNNMQVISSLLNLQSGYVRDSHYIEMLNESKNRIQAMALIHEKLYQSKDIANIDFNDYIKSLATGLFLFYGMNTNRISLVTDAESMNLSVDTAIPCGLLINELISNSLKHAFPDGREGEIRVEIKRSDDGCNNDYELVVADNGIGMPKNLNFRKTQSLGLQLVTTLVEHQLRGSIGLERTEGTVFHICFKGLGYRRSY